MSEPAAYPSHWEADVVLRDGSTMRIRPISPDDAHALQSMHMAQSERSQYFRFFAPIPRLSDKDLHRFTHVDHEDRVALVMVTGEEVVAVGRFDRLIDDHEFPHGDVAEVAFNVSDQAQGRGLGSILLEHLAAAGREKGIRRFVADVLPANRQMLRVFADAGYDVKQRLDDGVVTVNFTIRPTDRSMEVLAERERRAEALSMRRILAAESVLIYGSGEEGEALAARISNRIADSPFTGTVLSAHDMAALRQVVASLDAEMDLAVLAAPPEEVMQAIPPLGQVGTGAVLIPTGGFATTAGEEGVPQADLLRLVRRYGIRLVGPRSYGVVAQSPQGALPVILTSDNPVISTAGAGIFCQSSHAARALLVEAKRRRLPVATVLAAGHRADVSGNDTMQFWAETQAPDVACIYLESIGNPRKFSRVARYLARKRPVIATIAGSTGQARPPGHPVRAGRAPRQALEQLMKQAGVLQSESVGQQLDWAMAFMSQPLPQGDRVAVLTNSGTHQVVLQELLDAAGADTVGDLPSLNPVAGAKEYAGALAELASRADWDAAIITYGPYLHDEAREVSTLVAEFAARSKRTVLTQIHGVVGIASELSYDQGAVPAFSTGDDAIDAWAAMRRYAVWKESTPSPRVDPQGIDRHSADRLLATESAALVGDEERKLPGPTAAELLACYGIEVLPSVPVASVAEAIRAAEEIGWPVALKTADAILRHRADLGGVRLDLNSAAELRAAYEAMMRRMRNLGRNGPGAFDIQAMAPTGVACVLTAEEDPLYGPIMSFGLGGDAIELLGDISYRVPPLTEADARDLITSVKAAPRLFGHKNLPALAVAGLVEVVERLSVLKEELAGVSRIELNPVLVAEETAVVISAEVWLARPSRGDIARRALRE